jgi:hypothetical protein
MVLLSELFRNDAKLEAAAVLDSAHVLPNAVGPHVGKIQLALLNLDKTIIDEAELQQTVYGSSTAGAVLAFKQKRNIVNRSYQTQADNIVGKMTIAALDREILANSSLFKSTRIRPLHPVKISPDADFFRSDNTSLEGFVQRVRRGVQAGPQIVPEGQPIPFLSLEIRTGEIGSFQVINGIGRIVRCDSNIGFIFDPAEEKAHGGDMRVLKDPHKFSVLGREIGSTFITTASSIGAGLSDMLTLKVKSSLPERKVSLAFHFLGGPPGVATTRDRASLSAAVTMMNDIYGAQTRITFTVVGSGGALLIVPELANKGQLTFLQTKRTEDWNAVIRNRSAAAPINVFFIGKMDVADDLFAGRVVALTDNPTKPGFASRDCFVQDDLKGLALGLVLAHEVGHALGEDESPEEGHLMNKGAPGRFIPSAVASRMNKNAGAL